MGGDQSDTTLHVLSRGDFAAEHLAGPRRLMVTPNVGRLWRTIRGWPGPVKAWGGPAMRLAAFAKPSKVVGVSPPGGPGVVYPLRWLECHTELSARRAREIGYAPGAVRIERPVLDVAVRREREGGDLRVMVAPRPGREDRLRVALLAACVLRFSGRPVTLVSVGVGPMSSVLARLAWQLERPDAWEIRAGRFVDEVRECDAYLHVAHVPTDPLPWRTARAAGLEMIDGSGLGQRQLAQRLARSLSDQQLRCSV